MTKNMLTPHAAMLATLDNEPLWFISGIPHDGLIPTGADEVGFESPVSVSGEERSSYNHSIMNHWFGFPWIYRYPLMVNIPERKKDCTKDN